MGLLSNKLGIKALSMEDPSQPLLPYSALFESLGLGRSDAGVMVNEKQAMRLTTVFGCVTVISSDLAACSMPVYKKMSDGSTMQADHHPMAQLLDSPAPHMGNMTFRGAYLACALLNGNAYARIRRNGFLQAVGLQILPPEKTNPALVDGKLIYVTTHTIDGMPAVIEPDDMLQVSGLSFDGLRGLSPIGTCRNAFGLAIAAEKFGALFFGNGARSTGVLSHPGTLGTEAQENLKKSLREQMTGESALRPLILEEGMTWNQMTIPPNDAQFLQTRQFQRAEIAACYRVPLHLLQDLQRATNNNIEHQSLDYIRYCLRPWAVRIEQEFTRKLLAGRFYFEHNMNDFQRGDFASQTAGFALLRNIGVFSSNDIFRALRMNPIPASEGGDIRLAPLNMVPLASLAKEGEEDPAAPPAQTTDSDDGEAITDLRRERIEGAFRRIIRDAYGRIANRSNANERDVYRTFQPILTSLAETILAMYIPGDSGKLTDSQQELVAAHARNLWTNTVWETKNASDTATRLTAEAYAALHKALIG
jgi:HK97 family phage portal protein